MTQKYDAQAVLDNLVEHLQVAKIHVGFKTDPRRELMPQEVLETIGQLKEEHKLSERNFDHLDKNGNRPPVEWSPMYLTIDQASPAYWTMRFANIATINAECSFGYTTDPASPNYATSFTNYQRMLVPLGQKIFELHTGITNVGTFELGNHGVEVVTEATTFKLIFRREWKEVNTSGLHRFIQKVCMTLEY
jgi:hypothetical protein